MIAPRGAQLGKTDELLYRQVNPVLVDDGRVTSQAFRPGNEDGGLMSVHRGSKTTPELAFKLHTEQKKRRSLGVLCVSTAEAGQVGLDAYDDEEVEPVADPAHAAVDFRPYPDRKKVEKLGKKLRDLARVRGWLHPTPPPSATI